MKIKLIVIDLDGTTLLNQHEFHPLNVEIIKRLANRGYEIMIATGRPWRASKHFYELLELTTPIINYNGAYIHQKSNPDFPEFIIRIPNNIVIKIERDLKNYLKNIMCEYEEDVYLHRPSKTLDNFFWHQDNLTQYGKMANILKIDPSTFVIEVKNELYKEYIQIYMEQFSDLRLRFWDGEYSLFGEITYKGVNKDSAIDYVLKFKGINKEDILVIGDAGNDYEMIKNAGVGVAMIDGEDSVKKVAKKISEFPCKEGGAGLFLKKYFHLK